MRMTSSRFSLAVLCSTIVALGSDPTARAADVEQAAYRIHIGENDDDFLGWTVAGLGDTNGDGVNDYVVSAIGIGPFFEGGAYLYSGATGDVLHTLTVGDGQIALGGWSMSSAGDVDNDGRDDIILGRPFSGVDVEGYAVIFSGRTGAILRFLQGGTANGLTGFSVAGAGDVNGDGFDDVVVGSPYAGGGRITVYSGQDGSVLRDWSGGEKFGYVVAGVGDVNGDGHPDVAATEYSVGRVHVIDAFHGTLIRTLYGIAGAIGKFGKSLANAGDTNGDGVDDLVIGWQLGVQIFDGDTGNRLHDFDNGLGSAVAPAGDYNDDGYADVIMGDSWNGPPIDGRVEIRSGFDGALLKVFVNVLSQHDFGPSVAALGDIDGDDLPDILIGGARAEGDRGAAYVVLGGPNEMALFDGGLSPAYVSHPTHSISVDLDDRKNADLLTVNGVTNTLYVQMNRGDGTFHYPKFIVTGNNPTSVATLDIDRDDDQDVLVSCAGVNKVRVYSNTNGVLTFVGGIKTGSWPSSVVTDDFNRDGYMDFAVANRDDDTVRVFLHNKSSSAPLNKRFSEGKNYAAGDGPVQLVVGRFDGDQYADLAVADSMTAQIAVLVNNQNGRFHAPQMTAIDAPAVGLQARDLNHDSLTDLCWVDSAANLVMVSRGAGAGMLEPAVSFATGAQPSGVSFLDMNADGAIDLAVGNAGENSVLILLQMAGGVFVPSITMPTVIAPECVTALDVDDDEDIDLAVVGGSIGITNVLQNGWF